MRYEKREKLHKPLAFLERPYYQWSWQRWGDYFAYVVDKGEETLSFMSMTNMERSCCKFPWQEWRYRVASPFSKGGEISSLKPLNMLESSWYPMSLRKMDSACYLAMARLDVASCYLVRSKGRGGGGTLLPKPFGKD